jgi:hypothetical protein
MKVKFETFKNILTRPKKYCEIHEYSVKKPFVVHARNKEDGQVFNVTSIMVFPRNGTSEIKLIGGGYLESSFVGRQGVDKINLTVNVYKELVHGLV